MRNFLRIYYLLIGLSLLAACSSASNNRVKEAFKEIDTIALSPMSFVDVPFSMHGAARQIEEVIVAELERSGFRVIPSSEHQNIHVSAVSQVGSLAESEAKEANGENVSQAIELTHKELAGKHQVDAFAYPTIEFASADFRKGVASWHGVSQTIKEEIAPDCSLCGRVLHLYEGTIPASSLRLKIFNTDNDVIYTGNGGIELLARYVHQSFTGAGSEPIPEEELFRNRDRINEAVQVAFKAIIDRE